MLKLKKISFVAIAFLAVVTLWITYQLNSRSSLEPYSQYFVSNAQTIDYSKQLSAQYFGNATVLISDGETSIMTDGFFTRPNLFTMMLGKMQPDVAMVKQQLKQANVVNLAAVIAVHSHHDHALDSPEVAKQTGAMLVGSESTANIARGWGLSEKQILVPKVGTKLTFGRFTVRLIKSQHSPVSDSQSKLTGIGETIDKPLIFPASLEEFKEGGSFSIIIEHPFGNVLIHGSAGYLNEALQEMQADTVFLGVGGLGSQSPEYQTEYLRQTVDMVTAKRVVAIHWDDFTHKADKPFRPFIRLISDLDADMDALLTKTEANQSLSFLLIDNGSKIAL
jgi:L-ascorbate metabolism protein UlaG (beta-lactamase superfamily)